YKVNSLYMNWCVNCHRQPELWVRPRDQVFNMAWEPPPNQMELGAKLVAEYKIQKLVDCWTCHR
ncbi:MAG TPA: cytochrome C, partial [Bryobacteraceae bacterium]